MYSTERSVLTSTNNSFRTIYTVNTGIRAQKHDMIRAQLFMEAYYHSYEFLCIRKLNKIEKLEMSYCE